MVTDINYYFSNYDKFPFEGFFDDMKYPWEALSKVFAFLDELLVKPDKKEMHGDCLGKCDFYGNYYIGEGTKLYNGVTIIGPVYIGKNCELMPGCIVRPYTIIGDNCVLGHCSEVKHSVVFNCAKIQSTSFAGDSVIGKSARVGSGAIIANRKFDQSSVKLRIDEDRLDTGLSFFGCILGDNSRIGANSVTQPGTHIGQYSWIYPATNVRGFIPSKKQVYQDRPLTILENEAYELEP